MTHVITRRELFDLVWARPMVKIAADFGISDVGLKKICSKHRIPVPGRGYWAKIAAGAAHKLPLFHQSRDEAVERVVIHNDIVPPLSPEIRAAQDTAVRARRARKPDTASSPDSTTICEPYIRRLQDRLVKAKPDDSGIIRLSEGTSIILAVTPALVGRATNLLGRLLKGAATRGQSSSFIDGGLKMSVDGEEVSLHLEEKIETARHIPSEREQMTLAQWEAARERRVKQGDWRIGPERPTVPEWDFRPTGRLILVIDHGQHWDGLRRRFSDGKRQTLEGIVDFILDSAEIIVAARKAKRVEAERRAREWAEQERLRKERERRLILDEKRVEALELPLAKFARARAVEAFVDDYLAHYPNLPPNCSLLMEWARAYVASLRSQMAPDILERLLAKHRLMDDDTEIAKWVRVE